MDVFFKYQMRNWVDEQFTPPIEQHKIWENINKFSGKNVVNQSPCGCEEHIVSSENLRVIIEWLRDFFVCFVSSALCDVNSNLNQSRHAIVNGLQLVAVNQLVSVTPV